MYVNVTHLQNKGGLITKCLWSGSTHSLGEKQSLAGCDLSHFN